MSTFTASEVSFDILAPPPFSEARESRLKVTLSGLVLPYLDISLLLCTDLLSSNASLVAKSGARCLAAGSSDVRMSWADSDVRALSGCSDVRVHWAASDVRLYWGGSDVRIPLTLVWDNTLIEGNAQGIVGESKIQQFH